jgi:hypothetical protein
MPPTKGPLTEGGLRPSRRSVRTYLLKLFSTIFIFGEGVFRFLPYNSYERLVVHIHELAVLEVCLGEDN